MNGEVQAGLVGFRLISAMLMKRCFLFSYVCPVVDEVYELNVFKSW